MVPRRANWAKCAFQFAAPDFARGFRDTAYGESCDGGGTSADKGIRIQPTPLGTFNGVDVRPRVNLHEIVIGRPFGRQDNHLLQESRSGQTLLNAPETCGTLRMIDGGVVAQERVIEEEPGSWYHFHDMRIWRLRESPKEGN
jgi:hypothetical protein